MSSHRDGSGRAGGTEPAARGRRIFPRRGSLEETGALSEIPAPPEGANNLVVIVLDSLRFDTACEAQMSSVQALGGFQRRWSYASWTAPSHYNLLMGLLPHASPTHVYASEYYKEDFARYAERLNVEDVSFSALLPSLWLPTFLRGKLGYRTRAMVSLPVLNPATPLAVGFDDWQLMPKHNDFSAMVERLSFTADRPTFQLLNVGETHYPYALADEDPSEWPTISGVHGVWKHLDDEPPTGGPRFFDDDQLARLRARQVRAATAVDGLIAAVFDVVPKNTWVVVTSDHGELFGEGGYFGHGPIAHEKVHEVPFAEGLLR